MRKVLCFLLAAALFLSMAACDKSVNPEEPEQPDEIPETLTESVALILGTADGSVDVAAHLEAFTASIREARFSEKEYMIKEKVDSAEACAKAIAEAIESGATMVIAVDPGYESICENLAKCNPTVQIVCLGGSRARSSGLLNLYNGCPSTYEARYLAGACAGMKLAELEKMGMLPAGARDSSGNVKIGYIAYRPDAEAISGYTAYYLGVKHCFSAVSMRVAYLSNGDSPAEEAQLAEQLIAEGCVILATQTVSSKTPEICETQFGLGKVVYCTGNGMALQAEAKHTELCAPLWSWVGIYRYYLDCWIHDKEIATDYSLSLKDGACSISGLGTSSAWTSATELSALEAALKDGTLQVFQTGDFTAIRDGAPVTSDYQSDSDLDGIPDTDDAIFDGAYHECYYRSAPYFTLRINGISELN